MARLASQSVVYLGASLLSTAVALAVIPLATRIIGPDEYGALALAVGLAGLVTGLAQAAPGYVLQEFLPSATGARAAGLVSTALVAAAAAGLVGVLLLAPLTYAVAPLLFDLTPGGMAGLQIAIVATALAVPWMVCTDVLILRGRAITFAAGTVGQSVVNGLTTLWFLYVVPWPHLALFLGYAAGQVALLAFSVFALRRQVRIRIERSWFADMRRSALALGGARMAEVGRSLFERSYIGAWVGVGELGLFAHAQLYRNLAMRGLKSITLAIHPLALREAAEPDPPFKTSLATWQLAQSGIALGCIGFALFGRDVIGLLTNGKFVEATPLAFLLLLALLLQTLGIREQYLLIARLQGAKVSHALTISIAVAIAAMVAAVPVLGAIAVAGALVLQSLIQRAIIVVWARRVAPLPLREAHLAVGLALSVAAYLWADLAAPGLVERALVLAAIAAVGAVLLRHNLRQFVAFRERAQPAAPSSAP
ncbi:lipopolysaccharide biosynthesis protein [Roseospira navarrensis]|uniref:Polysaccharide biosynthesis protein n=1 Tax=Roseospira navarrensis TaxID=140058 RepID=A0A7X2D431_9PROT|nr:hypothetical protein [Roseospira navarrensis]MQX37416.1 hypothetical protein [Roseospira navarrensis]